MQSQKYKVYVWFVLKDSTFNSVTEYRFIFARLGPHYHTGFLTRPVALPDNAADDLLLFHLYSAVTCTRANGLYYIAHPHWPQGNF